MRMRTFVACVSLALAAGSVGMAAADDPDLRGAWHAETYLLEGGDQHQVQGLIFFTETDWTVLFFVTPDGQTPARGSAEGGTYTLSGDRLVFTHLYHLSQGNAVDGLSASPLRMEVNEATAAPAEPCSVDQHGEKLTIRFPSGNAMTFRRSSGP